MVPRRLHAPREHGQLLAIPELAEMPRTVERNRAEISRWEFSLLGRPIHEFRALARRDAVSAAIEYTQFLDSLIDFSPAKADVDPSRPLIVSGHQPELFHCGVWVKNFVLDHLARATNGIGLNLIVDNDAMPMPGIAVPVGSRDAPHIEQILFADVAGNPPWEEVLIRNEPLFRSFTERVSAALSDWSLPSPLFNEIWPAACAVLDQSEAQPARLADALTAARRAAERAYGLHNLELPISRLANTESFGWFVAWILADAPHVHATYNAVVESHRQANRIHSVSHPVPNLVCDMQDSGSERLEVPLWIWRPGDSRRSRLFVRDDGAELRLFAESEQLAILPHPARTDPAEVIAVIRSLAVEQHIKILPRALTNTLFARVFLGDTFLHGIGGAKYDEITDQLIARLYGINRPPEFLTVTATYHLPLGAWEVTSADVSNLKHRLWDFDHNPERFISPDEWPTANHHEAEQLLTERQRLIVEQHAKNSKPPNVPRQLAKAVNFRRCRRLRDIRRRLAELASSWRIKLQAEWQVAQSRHVANSMLMSREFSYGLFSSDVLQEFSSAVASEFSG